MQLSARNRLRGLVRSVSVGAVTAEVVALIGDQAIVAAITRGSAESLGLKAGNQVTVIIKATD